MKIKELERKLKESGCWFLGHGKRHDHWFSSITNRSFPIPRHGTKEMPLGTLKEIQKQSGVIL